VAFLRAQARPPRAQEVTLEIGTDDGVWVWLNGEVVHSNNAMRGFKEAEDRLKVALKSGWNVLLLKVTQGPGDWSAAVRIKDAEGGRLKGLWTKTE
jgi:hypothetical protein